MEIEYREQLLDYWEEFSEVMKAQIESDQKRWGDTWKNRGLVWNGKPQEERMFTRFDDYKDQFEHGGNPVPFTKIVGEAFICWVRQAEHDSQIKKSN